MTNLKVGFGERWGSQAVFAVVCDGDALLAMLSHFSFCSHSVAKTLVLRVVR